MQNKRTSKLLLTAVCIMLSAAMALFCTACGGTTAASASSASEATPSITETMSVVSEVESAASEAEPAEEASALEGGNVTAMGEGATQFTFTVIDGDGNETDYEISTDETTVGAALLALGLIEGEDSEYGLYVKTVQGITADYDTDGTYWAFYINDQYAETGVDATDIEAGAVYSFRVE